YCRLCDDRLRKKLYASDWERGEQRRDLFRRYKAAWLGPMANWPARNDWYLSPPALKMRRGLAEVIVDLGHLRELPASLSAEAWAWVGSLTARAATNDELVGVAGCPLLDGPAEVHIYYSGSDVGPT